ncbi:hypothetical protein [Muricoccus radiodurans]|uniref:hypothetical protein n=1 Tax=Muricoccus radiodurans TaxID=2231721 RepID=UPI003CF255F1
MTADVTSPGLGRALPSRALLGALREGSAAPLPGPAAVGLPDATPAPGPGLASRFLALIRPVVAPLLRPVLRRLEQRVTASVAAAAEARLATEIAALEARMAARIAQLERRQSGLASAEAVEALRRAVRPGANGGTPGPGAPA